VWTCRIRPLGAEIVLGCDEPLVSAVERQLSPWSPQRSQKRPHAFVKVLPGGRPFALHVNSRTLHTDHNLDGLMVGLQNWIDSEVTRAVTTRLVAVHAGVVAWKGRALLLPGSSGAGKTTLVSALVARGATYYSDELAFVDNRGWVHAYPRHLVVRDSQGVGRPRPVPAAASNGLPLELAPVAAILGVHFEAGATWQVARVPASDAVLLLLANTVHRLSVGGIPTALLQAVASAASYRGRRGDAVAAAAAMLQLIEYAGS
jgi:hypothetical protein